MTDKILVLKSGENITKFLLTNEIVKSIEYLNFLEYCDHQDDEIILELEYNKYLCCISDITSLLCLKSDNFLSIIRESKYYLIHKNIDMVNYYLYIGLLKLDDIISDVSLDFLSKIDHVPSLIMLYFYYYRDNEEVYSTHNIIIKVKNIKYCVHFKNNTLEIYSKDKNLFLYRIELDINSEISNKPYIFEIDSNDIISICIHKYVFLIKIELENYKILKQSKGTIYGSYQIDIKKNRYYYFYDSTSITVYDLCSNKFFSLKFDDKPKNSVDIKEIIENKIIN